MGAKNERRKQKRNGSRGEGYLKRVLIRLLLLLGFFGIRPSPACGYASFHQSVQSLDEAEQQIMPPYVSPRVSVRRSANLNSSRGRLSFQLGKSIKRRSLAAGAMKLSPLRSKW